MSLAGSYGVLATAIPTTLDARESFKAAAHAGIVASLVSRSSTSKMRRLLAETTDLKSPWPLSQRSSRKLAWSWDGAFAARMTRRESIEDSMILLNSDANSSAWLNPLDLNRRG
jgi:hypothetical protein